MMILINFHFYYKVFFFLQDPPENFATNLLQWVSEKLNKSYAEIAAILPTADPTSNRVVCSGQCFDGTACDPNDIGCHCCPY